MEERPKPPLANVVFGDTIYWVCVIATILSMIGPCISILFPDNNLANPYYIFSAVWEGKNSNEVWAATTQKGKYPGPHFWINHLFKGDGITQLGAWLGCISSLPAVLFAGFIFLFKRDWGYWIISWLTFLMILFAVLGIIRLT